jgi:hypothetical protein
MALMVCRSVPGDDLSGRVVYRQKCAACHGANGEGTEEHFPQALVGDKSVGELTELITDTMPEESPADCVGEEAALVAAWIHAEFYSDVAQARLRPARVAFSRLTVRQYENAVADLLGSFTGTAAWGEERGLEADYYNERRFRRDKRVIERTDPAIDVDFEDGSPNEEIGVEEFSIRWTGSVFAPETGDYEFVMRTENGARLWVNDTETPLIDAWVKSGDQTEYRGSIRLLTGRAYPLRLEFFKFKEPTASIQLRWQPPHHAEEVIPTRALSPQEVPSTFVVTTPFPPDDRSEGYERGVGVSPEWDAATTYAALEIADYVLDHLRRVTGVDVDDDDAEQRLREFCGQFATRAFRRPLSDDEQELYVHHQFAESPDPITAVKRSVILTLKSPRFLYHEFGRGEFDDYAVASWLSFALWDSLPDQELLEAAANSALRNEGELRRQVDGMLTDLRTRSKLQAFFHQWLHVDLFPEIAKDAETFPGFDEHVISDLRSSLDLFLDDVVWNENSDFRRILSADTVYMNGRLASYYGVDLPEDAAFEPVQRETEPRAGVLTHPYLMAGFAYDEATSPIHRGVFLSRSVLGRFLKPPPEAIAPFEPDLHPDLTTRERVILQTEPVACQTCHGMINPLGFTLENFDAIGRYREQERGREIDAGGSYITRDGQQVQFSGVGDLAKFLTGSEEVHDAFIEQLFQHTTKQPIQAFGDGYLDELRADFAKNEFNIQRLLAEIAVTSALRAREL